MNKNRGNLKWLIILAVLHAGCAVAPKVKPPEIGADIPSQWASASNSLPLGSGWLQSLGGDDLKGLVDEALAQNKDLQIAWARMESARAEAKKNGANVFPAVNLKAGALKDQGLRRLSDDERKGIPDSFDGFKVTRATTTGIALASSWELDVWGRVRNAASATQAAWQASQADYRWARLSLAAQVARLWFASIGTKQQDAIAARTAANLHQARAIMHSRWKNGKVAESDLHIAEGMLETSKSEAKLARLRYGNAIRALETLLGRYPCATLPIRDDFPKFPQTLAAGLPAEMLERRPDLARSEREVAAALKWTSSARAAQLPRISLTAEGGTASSALRDLADPKHLIWNMAVNMLTPVLDGGRLAADVDRADARAREAVARYGREALNALREVESFLDAEQALGEREKRLGATFEHMSASHTAALSRMEKGAGDPIFTLDTERIALAAKKDWSLAIMEKWQNRVDLCLALGGDFERKAEKKQP